MSKKLIFIIAACIVALALLLYFVPWPTPIDITLDAVKIDFYLEELGKHQIKIQGYRLDYLFQETQLIATVTPFDDQHHIGQQGDDGSNRIKRTIEESPYGDFLVTGFTGVMDNDRRDTIFWEIGFAPDMQMWALRRSDPYETTYYLASLDGDIDIDYFKEYFTYLMPGWKHP